MQLKQLWILELSTLKIWFHNLLMCHNIRLYTPCLPVRNGSIRNVYWILGIFGNLVLQLLYFEVKGILSPHPRPVHRHGEWAPGMRLESPTIQAGRLPPGLWPNPPGARPCIFKRNRVSYSFRTQFCGVFSISIISLREHYGLHPPTAQFQPPHWRPRQRPNPTHAPQNHSPKYVYPWEWHRKPQAGPHRCPGAQPPVEQLEPPSIREAVHSTLMHILLYINCRYISFDLTVFLFCLF